MKQCAQRYEELRYSRNHRRYNQSQKIYDAQFITADCTKVCWGGGGVGGSAFAATSYPGSLPSPCSPISFPEPAIPWEGNGGSGIIRDRHTKNCMSPVLRMRWK